MANKSKWLLVPLGYTILQFVSLVIWWHLSAMIVKPDPSVLSAGVGTAPWLALKVSIDGTEMMILTLFALPALPPIDFRQASHVTLAAVGGMWIAGLCWLELFGSNIKNGQQLLLTAGIYAGVLLCSVLWIRRRAAAWQTGD